MSTTIYRFASHFTAYRRCRPLGLIYTRPLWAIGMSLLSVPVAVLTASLGLLIIWPACMLLGYQQARKHNAGE